MAELAAGCEVVGAEAEPGAARVGGDAALLELSREGCGGGVLDGEKGAVLFVGTLRGDPGIGEVALEASEAFEREGADAIDTEIECEPLAGARLVIREDGRSGLEEGIAARASDIDVVWLHGYGWPVWHGGPMFYADSIGARTIVAALEKFARQHGADFAPAALLARMAREERHFFESRGG